MPKKILIIEDDEILASMYKKKFEISNYVVLEASNGEEGLSIALEQHPSIVLLDIMLPKINGLTLMDQLRADIWGSTVPIIILTNLDPNDEIIQKVITDQPSYYILKANSIPEEIVEKANQILKTK